MALSLNRSDCVPVSPIRILSRVPSDRSLPEETLIELRISDGVYIYARSKGYNISVGRIGKLECDFILEKNNTDYSYVQVAMTIMNSIDTEDREYRPLEIIKDNYPKYLVTRNDLIQHRNGILHVNIAPFMKENRMF